MLNLFQHPLASWLSNLAAMVDLNPHHNPHFRALLSGQR